MTTAKPYDDPHLMLMRQKGDDLADSVVRNLFEIGYNPMIEKDYNAYQFNAQPIPASFPKVLGQYFETLKHNSAQIAPEVWTAGHGFFSRYASELLAMLGFLSLPYCYAAADGAQVLYRSKRIRESPEKRLLETAAFVFDVSDKMAFTGQGKGIISIGKVRLMHAAIRYHILRSGHWPEALGTPINQEDMAGTNLAFSLISVRGIRKLGYQISTDESWAFIDMWNKIGLLLGVDESLLPGNSRQAYNLEKAIARRNFRKSEAGIALTAALHEYMRSGFSATGFVDPAMVTAFLVGEDVAPMIGLKSGDLLPRLVQGVAGLNAIKSLLRADGDQKLREAKKLYQQQVSGKRLEPFRLLNNLTD